MLRTLSILIACALSAAAMAGTVYKCRDGERISYGDQPCRHGGGELRVPAAPAPDPDAAARLERTRAYLAQVDRTRAAEALREERAFERARREALAQRRRCDKLRLHSKWADEDLARSSGERAEAARLKARRQQEALAVECPA